MNEEGGGGGMNQFFDFKYYTYFLQNFDPDVQNMAPITLNLIFNYCL